jgi:ATP-dependent Clp protease ATP-binding subunit ClpX
MTAGPDPERIHICEYCLDQCREIIARDQPDLQPNRVGDIPKPHEIKTILDDYVIGQDQAAV